MTTLTIQDCRTVISEIMHELRAEAQHIADDCGMTYADMLRVREVAERAYLDGGTFQEACDAAQAFAEQHSGIDRCAPDPMPWAFWLTVFGAAFVVLAVIAGWLA